MKKIAAMIVILALGLAGGCAEFKSFLVSEPVNYVCGGEEAKLTAADMLAALELGSRFYQDGISAVDIEMAFAALTYVKKTGCFMVDQLKKAFEVVDAVNVATAKNQVKLLTGSASFAPPEYPALRKYVTP